MIDGAAIDEIRGTCIGSRKAPFTLEQTAKMAP